MSERTYVFATTSGSTDTLANTLELSVSAELRAASGSREDVAVVAFGGRGHDDVIESMLEDAGYSVDTSWDVAIVDEYEDTGDSHQLTCYKLPSEFGGFGDVVKFGETTLHSPGVEALREYCEGEFGVSIHFTRVAHPDN